MTRKCRKTIKARKVWKHEAHDFTPYLYTHIDELANCVGLNLKPIDREVPVKILGSNAKYIDILAKDIDSGNEVIIENQFGISDENHHSRCHQYLAFNRAKTVIWICEKFTDVFRTTLNHHNETSNVKWYGIELHVFDDGSYHYNVVVTPKAHNSKSDVNSTNTHRIHKQRKSSTWQKYTTCKSKMEDIVKHSKTKSCTFEFGNIPDERNWLPIKNAEFKEKFGCRLDVGLAIHKDKTIVIRLKSKLAKRQSKTVNMTNIISRLFKYENESKLAISNEIKWTITKNNGSLEGFTIEYTFDAVNTNNIIQITDQFYNFFKEIQF